MCIIPFSRPSEAVEAEHKKSRKRAFVQKHCPSQEGNLRAKRRHLYPATTEGFAASSCEMLCRQTIHANFISPKSQLFLSGGRVASTRRLYPKHSTKKVGNLC